MYPYTVYIEYGHSRKLIPATVECYQQAISAEAFSKAFLDAGYKLCYKRFKIMRGYDHLYQLWRETEIRGLLQDKAVEIVGEPQPLYAVYREIGYDHKTKKLNGLTLLQHVTRAMGN